jgi:LysM repeat protein
MPKKLWQKAMGLALAISVLLNGILVDVAMAKTLPEAVHGKYYGQTLPIPDKVKTIVSKPTQSEKPLRLPQINRLKQPYQGRFKAEQELKGKRTLNSKSFSTGTGQTTALVYLDKIHYKDELGTLQDIDNTLVTSNKGKQDSKVYQNKANDFTAAFPASLTKGQSIKIAKKSGTSVELIPSEGDFTKSAVKDNAILYNDVFTGIDYQYTVLNTKVKEDIVLNNQVDKTTFNFAVKTTGVELKEEHGAISGYEQGSTTPAWVLSAPYMVDANGKRSDKVKLELDKNILTDNHITITVNKDWLTAPERAYPVRIDPTVTIESGDILDNCVEQGSPDTKGIY